MVYVVDYSRYNYGGQGLCGIITSPPAHSKTCHMPFSLKQNDQNRKDKSWQKTGKSNCQSGVHLYNYPQFQTVHDSVM